MPIPLHRLTVRALASQGGEIALDDTFVSISPVHTLLWCLHHFAAATHILMAALPTGPDSVFRLFCILCQFLPYVNPFACPPPAGKYSSPLSTPFMPRVSTGHAPFPMSPQGTSAANSSGKLLVCRVLSDFQVFTSFPLIPLVWPVFF